MSAAQEPPKATTTTISGNPAIANRLVVISGKIAITDVEKELAEEISALMADTAAKLSAILDKSKDVDVGTAIRAHDALRHAQSLAVDSLFITHATKRARKD